MREKEISLPPLTQTFGNVNCLMFTGGTYPITAVTLEKRISDFIPDIVLQLGEATLLVEIYVTHAVDEEKKLKIVQAGQYDVIEIDLSDKVHDDITDDELRLLIHDQARVHWIHSTATSFYTRNLASVAMSYPVEGPQQMVAGCPLGKMTHVQRRLPDCSRCRFFLGTDSGNAARCLLAAHLASRAGQSMPPLPRLWNVEKQYDEIPRQKVEPAVRPTTISRRQERPFYGTRNMSRKKYRKLVNAGKIRL